MVSREVMIKFYEACGYGPLEAIGRAARYMDIQSKFEKARDKLAEMTDEDEEVMKNHIHKQRGQSDGN